MLSLRDVRKTFFGTPVLKGLSMDVAPGEVHALIGTNGSGKSTIIKILSGFHVADEGSKASFNGEPVDLCAPERDTDRLRFVHQNLGQVLELNAVDNMGLATGFRRGSGGRIDWRRQRREAEDKLAPFGVEIDVTRPLGEATPLQRTVVAIATALAGRSPGHGLLVLDEPTAALPPHEVTTLFKIVREVRASGTSVIYVSHRMDEIFSLADKVSVLRGGTIVGTVSVDETTPHDLATMMVGASVETVSAPAATVDTSRPRVLEVQNLRTKFLDSVDLSLQEGEILGVAGLQGSGRDELPYAVAGVLRGPVGGRIRFDGESEWRDLARHPAPLPIVPSDRLQEGLVAEFDVGENLTLGRLSHLKRGPFLDADGERALVSEWMERLNVVPNDPGAHVLTLSGGNQQKLVMGRLLADRPPVAVLCDPTAGVDIATRQALYRLIEAEAAAGLAFLVASADMEDLTSLCHRAIVLRDGRITCELRGADITESNLTHAMEGTER